MRKRLVWVLLLLLVAACSAPAAAPGQGGDPRRPPEAVAAAQAKGPTLLRIEGKLWVVGLPYKHGWARERRVLLTQRDAARGVDRKVGVVVVLDDSYASAAPVGIVYEEPGESFDGAHAEIVPSDQRLRVGRGFGSLSAVVTSLLVEITLGSQDGVEVGDVYEVLALEGTKAVARVKVVSLEATRAKAAVLNAWPMVAGQEVVYQKKSGAEEQARQTGVTIAVCDFEPMAHDVDVARAGQSFAAALAKDLRGAAASWPGLTVIYVPQIVDSHASARIVGRDKQADVVVWGAATCVKDVGCAQPSYTVVDPAKVAMAERSGKGVKFDPGSPWSAIDHGSAKDPTGLVVGLLGSLAYEAQRYGDAAFYLGRVPEGAMVGEDHFRTLRDLGYSQYVLGRIESALDTAGRLERDARGKDRGWEAVGVANRARILRDKGQMDEAIKLHRKTLAIHKALGNQRDWAVALGFIARILTDKGQVDEALKLHRETLTVHQTLGTKYDYAIALGDIAHILRDKGQMDEALKLHREALITFETLKDRRERVRTLVEIARILETKGQVDEALKLYKDALTVYEALEDRRSWAITLGDIGRILNNKGQTEEALKRYQEQLVVFEALKDRSSRALTLGNIAGILRDKGRVDDALKQYREELAVHEALGERRLRAMTLGSIAHILLDKGQVDDALRLHQERVVVFETLGDRRERGVTLGDIARILAEKGQVDDALKLYREKLTVFDVLGDPRMRASTLSEIASTLEKRGEFSEALKLYQEALTIFDALGDPHARAATLGAAARVVNAVGQVDDALELLHGALDVYEKLGRPRERSVTLFDIAQIHLKRKDIRAALPMLRESYEIALALGDAFGTAFVGQIYARTLHQAGAKKEVVPIVARAAEALVKIGKPADAEALREFVADKPPKRP